MNYKWPVYGHGFKKLFSALLWLRSAWRVFFFFLNWQFPLHNVWKYESPPIVILSRGTHSSVCACMCACVCSRALWDTSWSLLTVLAGLQVQEFQCSVPQAQFPPQRFTKRHRGKNTTFVVFSSSRRFMEKLRGVQLYSLTSSYRRSRSTVSHTETEVMTLCLCIMLPFGLYIPDHATPYTHTHPLHINTN